MTAPSALDTLIDLASGASDEAARRLGVALATVQDTEQKLALLVQYRDDYAARFSQNLTTGLTAQGYRNFRSFMDKLDDAIAGQQQIVTESQRRAAQAKTDWQATERKRLSYNTLADRAEQQRQQAENRRDQKQTDEAATRNAFYKRQA